ncbi:MAG: TolC family protein [Elusimicrobiota bacterium]|nr:TolC family protein [Elusimicrobiota bacterium]
MLKKLLFIISLLILIPLNSFCQNKLIITLDDAIKMALTSSEDLQMVSNGKQIKSSDFLKAKRQKYPNLFTSFSWSKNLKYPGAMRMNDYSMEMGLTLTQKIFTFGKIAKSVEIAAKKADMSSLDEVSLKKEIIYLTKSAYFSIYLAKKIHKISYESLERARQNKAILEKRSSSGRASKYDNIKAASDIAGRIPSLNDAKANLNTIIHTFIILLGFDDFNLASKVDISDDIFKEEYKPLDHLELLASLLTTHPSLKKLKLSVSASDDRIDMLGALYYPEINAFSSYSKRGYDNSLVPNPNALGNYGMLGISFNLPLFDAGTRQENIGQAKIIKNNSQLMLEKKKKELILELENAVSVYNELIKTLKANENAINLAETSFKMSKDMFKSGHLSITNLNDSELYLTGQKIKKEITLVNLEINLAEIEKLAGAQNE